MKIAFYSDLHTEAPCVPWQIPKNTLNTADVLVFAGDIGEGIEGVEWVIDQIADRPKHMPVIYVKGNHENYFKNLQKTDVDVVDICKANGIISLVHPGDHVVIDDVVFMGGTLWTDFSYWFDKASAKKACLYGISDYNVIGFGPTHRLITPDDVINLHQEMRSGMEQLYLQYPNSQFVVVTHMAPTKRSTSTKYANEPTTSHYVSTMDLWIKARPNIKMWIHGHVHVPCDYVVDQCQVLANPKGYHTPGREPENPSFQFDGVMYEF